MNSGPSKKSTKTFIIAEAGVNHNGELELAKKLVDSAAQAGADAVKFQTFKAERLACKGAPKADYQLQSTDKCESQMAMLKRLELDEDAHRRLIRHCDKRGIRFMSSSFDLEGAEDALTELSGSIEADKELRDKMAGRVEKLKKEGWSFKGLESILEIEPYRLQDTIDDLEDRVLRLSSANEEMASWDEIEKRNLSDKLKELRGKLKDLGDVEAAIDIFKELQATIQRNKENRGNIKKTLDEWKDIGYIISSTSDLQDGDIEALSGSFEELREKIGELESIQEEFDALDTKHFPKEAEEIEFKLNDPGLLEEIRDEMKDIRSKIQADKEKREEYRQRIDDYTDQGFMGAEKLSSFLDEDIAIVDLEFRNFAKEIDQFRKLKEKVGFLFNVNNEEPEEVEAEEEEE